MERNDRPTLVDANPAMAFLSLLRSVRDEAGLTYRELATDGRFGQADLETALRGDSLPEWELVEAVLRACGVSSDRRCLAWEQAWRTVAGVSGSDDGRAPCDAARHKADEALDALRAVEAAASWGADAALARTDRRRRDQIVTSLRLAESAEQLGEVLQQLRARHGFVSYRALTRTTGIPKSTLEGWFKGRRPQEVRELQRLVSEMGASRREQEEFARCVERIWYCEQGLSIGLNGRPFRAP